MLVIILRPLTHDRRPPTPFPRPPTTFAPLWVWSEVRWGEGRGGEAAFGWGEAAFGWGEAAFGWGKVQREWNPRTLLLKGLGLKLPLGDRRKVNFQLYLFYLI